ncbi:MAG: diadenylate cyclase CdaA [Eubacteriales bacterium]|nr:diadenylate cyclase CdaA [Eubacteriales bacterium]
MTEVKLWISQYMPWLRIPNIHIGPTDIIEIIILSFLVYNLLVWVKNTRAWTLMKGMMFLGFFVVLIYIFEMDTMIFLIERGLDIVITAAIIIFQPELRKALERLGEKEFFSGIVLSGGAREVIQRCSDKTVHEIVRATVEMAKAKTGALMVLEQNETLAEYERTGITLDALVTSQLLINIFEHNTPLHDGAVIIREDKILSATCYLPLSENQTLDKGLGTRHRAGVGISEVTDSLTIIVSEETGKISIAKRGTLTRNVTEEHLHEQLVLWQNKSINVKKRIGGGKGKGFIFPVGKKGTDRNEA